MSVIAEHVEGGTVGTRQDLKPFPLDEAVRTLTRATPGALIITMGKGQWDALLSAAYEAGWILLEVDADEKPVRAYRLSKPEVGRGVQ